MPHLLEESKADPFVPRLLTLERTQNETSDTFTMELVTDDGLGDFRFLPGQFNMIGVGGVGEVPISISGDPDEPRRLVHTTREVGAVTRALKSLKPGATVTVRGPYGTPWRVKEAQGCDLVLVAGGIGLAPLRPVIYTVMAERMRYGRLLLLYGTRTPADILFAKQLAKWRAQFDIELLVTVDRATPNWRGNVGFVSSLIPRAPFDPAETVAMVCGPEPMMRASVQELQNRGISNEKILISMERNMKCGVGLCGHCQLRGEFVCVGGPVYSYDQVGPLLGVWEL